jgi:RNA polymerase sigma-70 factor (ECF subfamily)
VQEQVTDHKLREALAALLPELRAFARYLAGSRAEADDLVQETLLRSLRSLDGRAEGVNLRAWCLAVLRNTFYEQLRLRRREAARLRDTVEPPPQPPAQEVPAEMRDLARQLATLPPLLREALLLVGAQGLSYEEAAQVCNVPLGTMKARVSRARRQLTATLDPVID